MASPSGRPVAGKLLERAIDPLREKEWDPSEVMRDVTLGPEFREGPQPILQRRGLSLSDVTVKHPFSKVEHKLTLVDGMVPPLYLLQVDFRVVDKVTQDNVDALERLPKLVPPGVRIRIFTGSDVQPARSFERLLKSWQAANSIDAQFVQQRHFREIDADDETEFWDVLGVPVPDAGAPAVAPRPSLGGDEADTVRVFVSYAHKDSDVFARVQVHLGGLVHSIDRLDIWTDERIEGSDVWRDEIDTALQQATSAVLLVSADFLASKFVSQHELPQLLDAAQQGRLRIFWLKAESGFVPEKISRYQSLYPPDQPLGTLDGDPLEAALEQAMATLIAKIRG